jgi:hypothetical protein
MHACIEQIRPGCVNGKHPEKVNKWRALAMSISLDVVLLWPEGSLGLLPAYLPAVCGQEEVSVKQSKGSPGCLSSAETIQGHHWAPKNPWRGTLSTVFLLKTSWLHFQGTITKQAVLRRHRLIWSANFPRLKVVFHSLELEISIT